MHASQPVFTLLDVCRSIQRTLSARYGSPFWVKAEMHKLNLYPASGHCFPEFLHTENGQIVADMKATFWRSDNERVNRQFLQIVKEPLKDGIEILFEARIQYDPRYGLSLRICDIDPTYVLGSLERERALCVQRLKEEGLWERNRNLPFAKVPSRIAVISAETSKGYSDFMQVLQNNSQGYSFYTHLFPALLQGEMAERSLMDALQAVRDFPLEFDVVAIIRGGGGDVGLNVYNHYALAKAICAIIRGGGGDVGLNVYNHYALAKAICEYPLPVLSGIGHSTNLTVSEEVSYFHAITPTELAVFLFRRFDDFYAEVIQYMDDLARLSRELLASEAYRLENLKNLLKTPLMRLKYEASALGQWKNRLERSVNQFIKSEKDALKEQESLMRWADPVRNLKRGYSLTYQGDKLVFSAGDIAQGGLIRTVLAQGSVESRVEKVLVSEEKPVVPEKDRVSGDANKV